MSFDPGSLRCVSNAHRGGKRHAAEPVVVSSRESRLALPAGAVVGGGSTAAEAYLAPAFQVKE